MSGRILAGALMALALSVPRPATATETGIASWYGPGFHGRRTASGARFDQWAMTCAHRRHRFGTRLRVTLTRSGRSVVCRVTDRGPFVRGRIVDLSRGAARRLGLRGIGRVRVDVVK